MPSPHDDDELYRRACALVRASQSASVSRLQRELRLGYNSAARLVARMAREGVIGSRSIMPWGRHDLPPEPPGLIINP
ncbi:DNA translocase FtsK [Sphingobium nicotianae]|uniref:FtsK gamma domain-containing protein n=1 Tax=Sphingobium nicotianae TaxID=2782607 RepID=A0A9X1DBT8_9SPHN|nr:DNA translocase FtsK [Sphingobium nicotianae]MBT2186753.1 hypothetical protein [Sphingobium nicotianae]